MPAKSPNYSQTTAHRFFFQITKRLQSKEFTARSMPSLYFLPKSLHLSVITPRNIRKLKKFDCVLLRIAVLYWRMVCLIYRIEQNFGFRKEGLCPLQA